MVTEGGAHVVVNLESVRHVDVETFFLELGRRQGWSQAEGPRPVPAPSSTPSSPQPHAGQDARQGSPPPHRGLGNPGVPGRTRKNGEKGGLYGERLGRARIPPCWPSPPRSPPRAQPHYGVPAVGCGARAPADDLVDAFLVDGSVAFLRGHRPRVGGGSGRSRAVSWRRWAGQALYTKPLFSPTAHTLTPHGPGAHSWLLLSSCLPWQEGPGKRRGREGQANREGLRDEGWLKGA